MYYAGSKYRVNEFKAADELLQSCEEAIKGGTKSAGSRGILYQVAYLRG